MSNGNSNGVSQMPVGAAGYSPTIEEVEKDRQIRLGPINMGRQRYQYYQDQFDREGRDYYSHTALRGVQSDSLLNQAYFSTKNIDLVQHAIQRRVYEMSEGKYFIGKQDENELVVIMRSVFLQACRNLPYGIKDQIAKLNELVVVEASTKILSGVEQYIGYIKDASQNYEPIDRPISMSSSGTKLLRGVTSTF